MRRWFNLVCAVALLVSSGKGSEKVIAIASAFAPELAAVKAELLRGNTPVRVIQLNGINFWETQISGVRTLFFLSGMSMVNAAMATQLVIDHFKPALILFSGIAGAVNPDLRPGDVVIPKRWIHQSEAEWFNPDPNAPGRYILPKWYTPKYGHFGMIFPADVEVVRTGEPVPRRVHAFSADPGLLQRAKRAVQDLRLPGSDRRVARVVVGGTGMSGPVFLDNGEYRDFAFKTLGANAHEMEGTAIAQVAYVNRFPFLIVRGISDLAGGQAGANQEAVYTRLAARNAAVVTAKIFAALAAQR